MHIGVINECSSIGDADIAFWTEACSTQLEEFCKDWGLSPVTCAFYAQSANLPDGDVRIVSIVDDVAAAGVAGYHDSWAGIVSAQVQAMGARTPIIMSHECLEMTKDPDVNQWRTMPDGKSSTAVEVCDAVEDDTYVETVTILGETRAVSVSNYLLPSWFDVMGKFPFDRMSRLTAPFTMTPGGYLIVKDENRHVSNVFASTEPERMAQKKANPLSRTKRRGSL